MAKLSTETPKDSRAGTPRAGKTVGVGPGGKGGDKEKEKGAGKGRGKEKEKEKEKGKKRRFKPENKDEEGEAEDQTPRKKKKISLKKRGAEKTVPPKVDGGTEDIARVANGEPKVGAHGKGDEARE